MSAWEFPDPGSLLGPDEPAALVERAGPIDSLIANLDLPAYGARVRDIEDAEWLAGFDAMVHPLMRLVRAATPGMIERGGGSIVALTSSSPLRRMKPHATATSPRAPPRTRSSARRDTSSPPSTSDSTRLPRTS